MSLTEFLRTTPFFRIFLPFVLGILLGIATFKIMFPASLTLVSILFLSISLFLINLRYSYSKASYYRKLFGINLHFLLILLGFFVVQNHKDELHQSPLTNKVTYLGRIEGDADEKNKSIAVDIKINCINDSNVVSSASFLVRAYLEKDSNAFLLKPGDNIFFNTQIKKSEKPKNPFQFDYSKYLLYKGIVGTAYIKSDDWMVISNHEKSVKKSLFIWRQSILDRFKTYGITGENFSVLAALTLGYKSGLDDHTRDAYSASGAMHILAVSGLHVGVLYLFLYLIFSKIGKGRKSVFIRVIISLTVLWMYAAITGFSPSVLRATVMFSFILSGELFQRKINIYNSIFASAFLLLLLNPFMIMQVGFLLSYLAVLGIVTFYPHLYSLLFFKNWVADKTWSLVCLSLAAQLSTFPLGILFFNQFPNYFLLTNIIVVPLASIIIYGTLIFIIFGSFSIIGFSLSFLLNGLLSAMNFFIHFIEILPGSLSSGLFINSMESVSIYILIILAYIYILEKRKFALFGFLIVSLMLFSSLQLRYLSNCSMKGLGIMAVSGKTVINIFHSRENIVFCDSVNDEVKKSVQNACSSLWYRYGVHEPTFIALHNEDFIDDAHQIFLTSCFPNSTNGDRFLVAFGKCFLLLRKGDLFTYQSNYEIQTTNLILANNIHLDSLCCKGYIKNLETIIFDSSNKPWKTLENMNELGKHNSLWNVQQNGAYLESHR